MNKIKDFNEIEIGDSFRNDINIYYVVDINRDEFKVKLFAVGVHNGKGLKHDNPFWITYPNIVFNKGYVQGIR